jgi:hypothetical protein
LPTPSGHQTGNAISYYWKMSWRAYGVHESGPDVTFRGMNAPFSQNFQISPNTVGGRMLAAPTSRYFFRIQHPRTAALRVGTSKPIEQIQYAESSRPTMSDGRKLCDPALCYPPICVGLFDAYSPSNHYIVRSWVVVIKWVASYRS